MTRLKGMVVFSTLFPRVHLRNSSSSVSAGFSLSNLFTIQPPNLALQFASAPVTAGMPCIANVPSSMGMNTLSESVITFAKCIRGDIEKKAGTEKEDNGDGDNL